MIFYVCDFFFNDTATTEISSLSLPDALPILFVNLNSKCITSGHQLCSNIGLYYLWWMAWFQNHLLVMRCSGEALWPYLSFLLMVSSFFVPFELWSSRSVWGIFTALNYKPRNKNMLSSYCREVPLDFGQKLAAKGPWVMWFSLRKNGRKTTFHVPPFVSCGDG